MPLRPASGREQQRKKEAVQQQVPAGMLGKCRYIGRNLLDGPVRRMRVRRLPVLRGHPAKQAAALGGVPQHPRLAGEFTGVAVKVAGESDPVMPRVVHQQREGSQDEGQHRDGDTPPVEARKQLPWKDQDRGQAQPGEHPDRQRFVPECEAEQKEAGRQGPRLLVLVEFHDREHAADQQKMLQRHRTPVKTKA